MFQFNIISNALFFLLFLSCFFKMFVNFSVQCTEYHHHHHLASILIEIKLNIYKNYPLCDDYSMDGKSKFKSVDLIFYQTSATTTKLSSAVRDINLDQNADLYTISLIFPINKWGFQREFYQKIVSKHHQHCPIFVNDVVSKSETNGSLKLELEWESESDGNFDEDKDFLHRWTKPSFYVFFIHFTNALERKGKAEPEAEAKMKNLQNFIQKNKYFQRIQNSAMLILPANEKENGDWKMFHVDKNYELKSAFESISRIEGSKAGSSDTLSMSRSMSVFGDKGNKLRVNWGGSDMIVLVCAVCGGSLGRFYKQGWWDDPFIALVYELSLGANATLVLENVFDMVTDNPDPGTGKWGDFIQPLIDGTATVSGPYKPSLSNRKMTLQSSSLGMDSVGFYVARPEQKALTSLWALQQPLSFSVWMGIGLTIISTFITLRLLIYIIELKQSRKNRTGKREKSPENFILLGSLIGILLDQSGYSSTLLTWFETTPGISSRIRRVARINMGFWFLGIIVISSLYKSRFISLMTLPQYENIPTNFPSLVQSDYEYGAVLWADMIKQHFSSIKNNSVSHALLEKVKEYSYVDSEYFYWKKVCIGLKLIMEMLGLQYLVDVHGQQLAVLSSDSYFPTVGAMGISKQFPEILDLLDFLIQSFEITGLSEMWMKNKISRQIGKGKKNAEMYVDNSLGPGKDLNGVYFGESKVDSTAKQITWLSCTLLVFGAISATLLFFSEVFKFKVFQRVIM